MFREKKFTTQTISAFLYLNHEIINEVNTEVVNNVVNDITDNNVNIAEAVADSNSTSIASAAADAYAESYRVEEIKPLEATPSSITTETHTDESKPASEKEDAPTVEPYDASATYLEGVKYHKKMQAADVKKKVVTMVEYFRFIMAPFIEDKHMDGLWKELRGFI